MNLFIVIIIIFTCAKVSGHAIYTDAVGHSKTSLQIEC